MKQFWQEVLALPYKSNSQDNPLHEQQVKQLLDNHELNYIYQPNGSQASPDFRVILSTGRNVDIECKSSKQVYPTFNGGLPKEGVVYIFSSAKYNQTTIFFAEDVVKPEKRKLYKDLTTDLDSVLRTYQMDEEWQNDPRGFDFYVRNMYIQTGRGKKDYFKHSDRQRCESNVINHTWN